MVELTGNLNSPDLYLAGENIKTEIRANAVFTASYVISNIIEISHAKNILLLISLDGTGITSSQLKIQFGIPGTLFDLVHIHMDTDTITNNPTIHATEFEMGGTTIEYSLPLINPGCSHMSCSVKANTADGSIALHVMRGQGSGFLPMSFGGAVA